MVDESNDVSRFRLDPKDIPDVSTLRFQKRCLRTCSASATGQAGPSVRLLLRWLFKAQSFSIPSSLINKHKY